MSQGIGGSLSVHEAEAGVDLKALAERFTVLRSWARREWAGPCPRCGGKDRFHVHRDGWWKCYRCHPRRAGVVAFLRWLEGRDFHGALERLSALVPDSRAGEIAGASHPRRLESPQNPRWQARAQRECAASVARLAGTEGEPARAYLRSRGLLPVTWQTWGLGFGFPWHPRLRARRPALVIPWREGGRVMAIQYRFIPVLEPGAADAVDHGDRFSQKAGGERRVYGRDLLGHERQALVVVEGELNALSIWQVLRGYPGPHAAPPALELEQVDVLSFGSEAGATSVWLRELAATYARVWLWADRGERAAQGAAVLRGAGIAALSIASPAGRDANDLLRTRRLARFLAAQFTRLGE